MARLSAPAWVIPPYGSTTRDPALTRNSVATGVPSGSSANRRRARPRGAKASQTSRYADGARIRKRALSAVYTYWDPAYAGLSLGTYSILSQLRLARASGLEWVYLGLAIAQNPSMAYKLRFFPHERRIGGTWRRFSRD